MAALFRWALHFTKIWVELLSTTVRYIYIFPVYCSTVSLDCFLHFPYWRSVETRNGQVCRILASPFLSDSISAHHSVSSHREWWFNVVFLMAVSCQHPTPMLPSPSGVLKWIFLPRIKEHSPCLPKNFYTPWFFIKSKRSGVYSSSVKSQFWI